MQNGQLNVTNIADKQAQPACRFSIAACLDGFPIHIEGEGKAGDLKAIVDRLKAIGAEPPNNHRDRSAPTKAAGVPACPDHNTPMKASRKPGTWFCPRQADGGGYCPHKT